MSIAAYDFLSPRKIVFGWGRRRELGALAASLGRKVWIISGSQSLERSGRLAELVTNLEAAGLETTHLTTIRNEPTVGDVDRAVAALRGHVACGSRTSRTSHAEVCDNVPTQTDVVCAIGGGAAIDLAKAVAALATQPSPGSVLQYLEGVGSGRMINAAPLPIIAVPSTAGTGSEATKNAVISSTAPAFKKSLRDERLVPQVALVDPELTVTAPPSVTAHSGMDAITQLIESALSCRARPIPSALCLAGLRGAADALRRVHRNPDDRPGREVLAQAALFSGMALANSGLGLAHGVAAALGVVAQVPHGLACAVMLPAAMRANRSVHPERWIALAEALCGRMFQDAEAAAVAAIVTIETLSAELAIPSRLRELQVRQDQIPALVAGSQGNSLAGNPRPVDENELQSLLEELW